ncbi:MAG: helix-turn-helix domain-containing protein [Lentilactobacillus buchneri]|nr:helix-turn-helix domain-containing protein [Lentilactobacillus buchneri]MCI1950696.1 helix-turn-helix domain-containing protein [Lentilactobacillus buchneri]MCI2018227.1 helix-turn-helix domain-containing protein [Lentilactobacillus buchneri]MCI2027822.1 helix-turn-helix domain-containing protein [Lentilactobacillus buchneri]
MSLKSNSVLYSFKNGKIKKPSFELMEKIADALNISMDEFRRR